MGVKYKRILLKISGEALAGSGKTGIDFAYLNKVAESIKDCVDLGVQVAIVVGGGNFWRGRSCGAMDRTTADHIGMLGTTMNALALADSLQAIGVPTRVQTAIEMKEIAEMYIRNRAVRHLEKGRVVVFGCGTGNPFFSTDTGAALRAAEIDADIFLKATNVDGVYTADPHKDSSAVKIDKLSAHDVLSKSLGVMDSTAASLCKDNKIPVYVFSMEDPHNIVRVVCGENIGTIIQEED